MWNKWSIKMCKMCLKMCEIWNKCEIISNFIAKFSPSPNSLWAKIVYVLIFHPLTQPPTHLNFIAKLSSSQNSLWAGMVYVLSHHHSPPTTHPPKFGKFIKAIFQYFNVSNVSMRYRCVNVDYHYSYATNTLLLLLLYRYRCVTVTSQRR